MKKQLIFLILAFIAFAINAQDKVSRATPIYFDNAQTEKILEPQQAQGVSNFDMNQVVNATQVVDNVREARSPNQNGIFNTSVSKNVKLSKKDAFNKREPRTVSKTVSSTKNSRNVVFSEDFEGEEGTYLLPVGWTQDYGTWSYPWFSFSDFAHTGDLGMGMMWDDEDDKDAWAFSPGFTLTAGVTYRVDFWVRMGYAPSDGDDLSVRFGQTPTRAGMESASVIKNFTNYYTGGAWEFVSEFITPTNTGTYYLGFYGYTEVFGGDDISIDDIAVIAPVDGVDVEVTQILSPNSGLNLTATEQVKVVLKNNGANPLTGFTLKLELNSVEIATETYSLSIPGLGQAEYIFTATLDLSAAGTHEVKVTATAAGDVDPSNNSLTKSVTNTVPAFAWTENFNGTTGTGFPTGWVTRVSTGTQIWVSSTSSAYDGRCAYHQDFNWSSAARQSYLITPAIELPAGNNFELSFMSRINTFGGYYGSCSVYISTTDNQMNSFSQILSIPSPYGTTADANWIEINNIQLGAYNGQTVYIAFVFSASYQHDWRIDNVAIAGTPKGDNDLSINAGVYQFTQVPAFQTLLPLKATVTNDGLATQTNIVVTAHNNGTLIGTSEPLASLVAGASEVINVPVSIASISNGVNEITFTVTQNETDVDLSNNTWTYDFLGTDNVFAADDGTYTYNIGSNYASTSFGNIFTITEESVLNTIEVNFAALTSPLAFNLMVYAMNGSAPASTPLVTQAATRPVAAGWVSVEMPTTSLAVGSYYVCAAQTSTVNFALVTDGNKYRPGAGINNSGTWFPVVNEMFAGSPSIGAPHIRMIISIPLDIDAEVVAITEPNSGTNLTNAEVVKAIIKNNGVAGISNFQLKLELNDELIATETYTETIEGDASEEYTFVATLDLSAAGNYNVTVTVILTGDQNPGNNSKTKTVTNTVCEPISVGWSESFDDTTFPPSSCWSEGWISPSGNPTSPVPWKRVTAGVSPTCTTHSGAGMIQYNSYSSPYSSGARGWLISPPINPQGIDNLALAMWMFRDDGYAAYNEGVNIYINETPTMTGATLLSTIYRSRTMTPVEAANGWYQYIILLPSEFMTNNAHFIIEGFSAYGNNIYVDDLSLIDFSTFVDGELAAILSPLSGSYINLSDNEQVKVKVKNNGGSPLADFSLKLELDGEEVDTETYSGTPIPIGGDIEYTFNATLDLSTTKSYTIKVTLIVTDDAVAGNDSKTITVSNAVCNPIAVPFVEGFTGSTFPPSSCWRNWQVEGTGGWARTTLIVHTPGSAYVAAASGNRNYMLIPPQLSIPEDGHYALEFWSYVGNPATYGAANGAFCNVLISTASGNPTLESFVTLKQLSGDDITAAWQRLTISLEEYAGQNIYIAFQYLSTASAHAWYIDDINIWDIEDYIDAEITKIVTPIAGTQINLTNSEPVTVVIRNNSGSSISGFDLKLELNDEEIVTEVYEGSIESLGQVEYTFTATLDLSAAATYAVKVTIDVEDDEDATNNSKTVTLRNVICNTIDDYPWTESFDNATFPIDCWFSYAVPAAAVWKRVTSGTSPTCTNHSGAGMLQYNNYSYSAGQKGYLVSPEFSTLDNALRLSFWMYRTTGTSYEGPGYADKVNVYLSETTDIADATLLYTIHRCRDLAPVEAANGWYQYNIPLPAVTMTTARFILEGVSEYGYNTYIDDISIIDISDVIDGSLATIISPKAGYSNAVLTDSEAVKILIKNEGGITLEEFDIIVELDGVEVINEPYIGNPIPFMGQVEYTLTGTLDLSEEVSFVVKVKLDVEDDDNLANNEKTITVVHSPNNVTLFAYRIYDDVSTLPRAFITFESVLPGTVTQLNAYAPLSPADRIYSGEHINGYFYCFTLTASGSVPRNFEKISVDTWARVATSPITVVPNDITYDYSTRTMFGVVGVSNTESNLVKINMETGATTLVGSLGRYAYTVACRLNGTLFIVDGDGNLCSVNKNNAATTVVGSTGITPEYIQTMSFDHNTNRLFWGMSSADDEGKLIEIDPTTGASTDLGTLGGNAEIIGLYSQYSWATNTVNITVNPIGGGTVNGGGIYHNGQQAVLSAVPNSADCYAFVNWTDFETGEVISSNSTIYLTVDEDKDIIANFTITSITIQNFVPENGSEWTTFTEAEKFARINFSGNIQASSLEGITVNGNEPISVTASSWSQIAIEYDYLYSSSYEIFIPSTAINCYDGDDITYTFTTPPILSITEYKPAEDATGVAINAEVSITLSKNATTLVFGTAVITITKVGGGTVGGVNFVAMTPMNPTNKLIINHNNFEYGAEYIVSISANTIPAWQMLYGNDPITWSFTTAIQTFEITAVPNNPDWGSVEGGGTFAIGDLVSLIATPTTGYHFVNWTEGGEVVDGAEATYTFNAAADRDLVANFAINTYNVTVLANPTEGGTVSGGGTFNHGANVTVTATKTGDYTFEKWSWAGGETISNPYTFTVTADITLTASFTLPGTILVTTVVNPAGAGEVTGGGQKPEGSEFTLTAIPNAAYNFVNWTWAGGSSTTNPYVFTPTTNITVTANFEMKTYTITASVDGGNGTISPAGGTTVNHGGNLTYTITPNSGYKILDVLVDDVSDPDAVASGSYTFTNVTSDHTIVARFIDITSVIYTITATVGDGEGIITPSGEIQVAEGGSQTFTMTPATGWKIDLVLIDGINDDNAVESGTYTFTNVNDDHTITVIFTFEDSIDLNKVSTLSVYPNPTNGKLFINSKSQINTVKVYDASGRLIMDFGKVRSTEHSFNMDNLASGVYFVMVDNTTVKVVKQ